MSNALLKTYAESQFGMISGKNQLDRFYSLIYELATSIRFYYHVLSEKNDCRANFNYDSIVSNFISSNQCNPDFIFYLIDQNKNQRHSVYCNYKVNRDNLGDDILMLKNINQKMSSINLRKFHTWITSYTYKLQYLDAEISKKVYLLLYVPDKSLLTVTHKRLQNFPIANQANKQQKFLTVLR